MGSLNMPASSTEEEKVSTQNGSATPKDGSTSIVKPPMEKPSSTAGKVSRTEVESKDPRRPRENGKKSQRSPVSDDARLRGQDQYGYRRSSRAGHSRSRSVSPPPRHSRRNSRNSWSPRDGESSRYRRSSRSPEEYERERDRYGRPGHARRRSRDWYRDRTPERHGRYDDRRRSRSRSWENYERRYRSRSPRDPRRSYYFDDDSDRERDRYYRSSRRRHRSRSRSSSPRPQRRRRSSDDIQEGISNAKSPEVASGSSHRPMVGYPSGTMQPSMVALPVNVAYPTTNGHTGIMQYPAYVAASPVSMQGSQGQTAQPTMMGSGRSLRVGSSQSNQQALTKSRRLYVGNLPFHAGLTEIALVHFFNALCMAAFGPSKMANGPPVISVWLHQDGKFGFMETRSEQDAVNVMMFNGVTLHGRPVRVNRPSDYNPAIHNISGAAPGPEKMNYDSVVELCNRLGGVAGPPNSPPAHLLTTDTENGMKVDAEPLVNGKGPTAMTKPVHAPEDSKEELRTELRGIMGSPSSDPRSRRPQESTPAREDTVVAMKNIVTNADLDGTNEEFKDLVDDIREECMTYGRVTSVFIPRTGVGRGTAFVGFSSNGEAKAAAEKLSERAFDNRVVEAKLVPGAESAEKAVEMLSRPNFFG